MGKFEGVPDGQMHTATVSRFDDQPWRLGNLRNRRLHVQTDGYSREENFHLFLVFYEETAETCAGALSSIWTLPSCCALGETGNYLWEVLDQST